MLTVVGYDDDTMPESAKGQNKSYKDYIMGTGYDKIEKTPGMGGSHHSDSCLRIRELAATSLLLKPLTSAKAGARNVTPMAKTPPEQFACYRSS